MKYLCLLLAVAFAHSGIAQSSPRFSIRRNAVAGGGVTLSTSSRFQLGSTVGQPIVNTPSSGRFFHSRWLLVSARIGDCGCSQSWHEFRISFEKPNREETTP